MKDDTSQNVASAFQVMQQMEKKIQEERMQEKRDKQASIRLESLLKEQIDLLHEANESAVKMGLKAEKTEQEARVAKRHSVIANIIAVLALAFAVYQFMAGN